MLLVAMSILQIPELIFILDKTVQDLLLSYSDTVDAIRTRDVLSHQMHSDVAIIVAVALVLAQLPFFASVHPLLRELLRRCRRSANRSDAFSPTAESKNV